VPEELRKRDREVGVNAAEHRLRAGATHDLLRAPRHGRGCTERSWLHEHVRLGHFRDRGVNRRSNITAGDHQHALRGNQRRQARHGVGDQRLVADQSQQLLRSLG
jgi:hypothetical protein